MGALRRMRRPYYSAWCINIYTHIDIYICIYTYIYTYIDIHMHSQTIQSFVHYILYDIRQSQIAVQPCISTHLGLAYFQYIFELQSIKPWATLVLPGFVWNDMAFQLRTNKRRSSCAPWLDSFKHLWFSNKIQSKHGIQGPRGGSTSYWRTSFKAPGCIIWIRDFSTKSPLSLMTWEP